MIFQTLCKFESGNFCNNKTEEQRHRGKKAQWHKGEGAKEHGSAMAKRCRGAETQN